MRLYLEVPYRDKEEAKQFGCKWDYVKKVWYIDEREDITSIMKWVNREPKQPGEAK